jgi:ABC-2 type transport system ATP-binding protein
VNTVAEIRGITKRYGDFVALDGVTLDFRENTIHGLLGRNGAGKTTLMRAITGQIFPNSGEVRIFGEAPLENAGVLERICFISEGQEYPDHFKVRHVMEAASILFPYWDGAYAESLLDDFALPRKRGVRKLSRGMKSALGITVGLASRAPLTFFDEPYLGLDAVARQLFYDRLLADYAENPRTIVLSTHLIDEVRDLLEHVVVIEGGRIIIDEDAETLRSRGATVSGPTAAVTSFTDGRQVLHVERLAGFTRATVADGRRAADADLARKLGVELEPLSLQDLVVRTTNASGRTGTQQLQGSQATEPSTRGRSGPAGPASPDVNHATPASPDDIKGALR